MLLIKISATINLCIPRGLDDPHHTIRIKSPLFHQNLFILKTKDVLLPNFGGENTRKCRIWILKVSYSSHLFRNDHSVMKERSWRINCWEKNKTLIQPQKMLTFDFCLEQNWWSFAACFGIDAFSDRRKEALSQTKREAPVCPLWHHKGLQNCGSSRARSKEENDGPSGSLTGRRRRALCWRSRFRIGPDLWNWRGERRRCVYPLKDSGAATLSKCNPVCLKVSASLIGCRVADSHRCWPGVSGGPEMPADLSVAVAVGGGSLWATQHRGAAQWG